MERTRKSEPILMTRDSFRESVFKRDGHKCIFCGSTESLDAHHIMERRLFPDGGYYLDNGATVCQEHHIQCEKTTISTDLVRQTAGIDRVILPPHLYDDNVYDKWGNIILQNGSRLRGELFDDKSVQLILGDVLHLFETRVKYPRTYHLPWSPGMHNDDRMHPDMNSFIGKRVIVTEKYDGECTSMYTDTIHARSLDYAPHPSRNWCKSFWSQIRHDIPEGYRICGENLYQKHSVYYENLPSYFMAFSFWNSQNLCLSWDETLEWFSLIGVEPVKVLYDGVYDEDKVRSLWNPSEYDTKEGYVMRIADAFPYGAFRTSMAKFVRPNHVQTSQHWMRDKEVVTNQLRKELNGN